MVICNHGPNKGVLLLNTVLTVEEGKAHSHKHLGWEQFTDKVIAKLNDQGEKIIFILWGSHALHKKGKNINTDKHFVIKGPHPFTVISVSWFFWLSALFKNQ